MLLKLRGKKGTWTVGKQEMRNGNKAENSFSFSLSL